MRKVKRIFSGTYDIKNRLDKSAFQNYKTYLQSEVWKASKNRFFDKIRLLKKPFQCYCCFNPNNLQVHHRTYSRLGKEYLNDLVLLCGNCHKKTHEIAGCSDKKLYNAHRILKRQLSKKII